MVSISSDWVQKRWRYAFGDKFHQVPLDPAAPIGDVETWAEGYPIVFPPGDAGGAAKFVKFEDAYDSWTGWSLNYDQTKLALIWQKGRHWTPNSETVLHLWNVDSRKRRVLKGHPNVSGALFGLKDPNLLFTTSTSFGREDADDEIFIWDLSSGVLERGTILDKNLQRSAEAAVDSMLLDLTPEERSLLRTMVYESLAKVTNNRVASGIPKLFGCVNTSQEAAAISNDGRYVVYEPTERSKPRGQGDPYDLKIYDLEQHTDKVALQGHKESITCVAWSPADKWIMTTSFDGSVRLWNTDTGEEKWNWKTKKQNWTGAFGPAGKDGEAEWAIATSGDGILHCWSLESGEEIWHHPGHGWPRALATSPSGRYVVVGRQDSAAVEVLDLHRDRGEKPHHVETATRRSLGRGDLRVPLSAEDEEETDPKKKEEIQFMADHMTVSMHEVRDVRFVDEHRFAWSASLDNGVHMYDMAKNLMYRWAPEYPPDPADGESWDSPVGCLGFEVGEQDGEKVLWTVHGDGLRMWRLPPA